ARSVVIEAEVGHGGAQSAMHAYPLLPVDWLGYRAAEREIVRQHVKGAVKIPGFDPIDNLLRDFLSVHLIPPDWIYLSPSYAWSIKGTCAGASNIYSRGVKGNLA